MGNMRVTFSLPNDIIEQLNALEWGDKSQLVASLLRDHFGGVIVKKQKTKKVTIPKKQTSHAEKQDKRNPDVQQLVDEWKRVMGDHDGSVGDQRRWAYLVINKVGVDKAVRSLQAINSIRSDQYAPRINSLKDLFYKWASLEDYFRKLIDAQATSVAVAPSQRNKNNAKIYGTLQ